MCRSALLRRMILYVRQTHVIIKKIVENYQGKNLY